MAGKTTEKRQRSTDEQKRNKVYYAARAELIENHQDEYRSLLQKHADEAGVTLKIRKTPEERAQEQIEKLLADNPALAAKYGQASEEKLDPENRFEEVGATTP